LSVDVKQTLTEELREKLSELEHDQWMEWTKEIASRFQTEPFFQYQIEQWRKSWIPYGELTDGQKDMDRIWADKTIEVILQFLAGHTNIRKAYY
jgi:hypothetical protein